MLHPYTLLYALKPLTLNELAGIPRPPGRSGGDDNSDQSRLRDDPCRVVGK
jgi:hypothetical protein